MKKTRILSFALCLALVLSSFSLTAMALSFDDVDNDSTVSWAADSITKMTDAGYIKGYEDGTFRPYKPITKIECLILMSRMLGLEDDDFECDGDCCNCDLEDCMEEEECIEIVCPSCGETVCFDPDIDPDNFICPACQEKIEVDFVEDDEE